MTQHEYDLIVLGGGPGGYVAALRGAQLGMRVALVEREHLGGICLNWGCIPTKALLRSAEVYEYLLDAGSFGLSATACDYDVSKIVQRSRRVAADLSRGVAHLLKKKDVRTYSGHGRLKGAGKVEVSGASGVTALTAAHVIVATGARPRSVPPVQADGRLVWDYKQAMTPERMPASLMIVGSGAIGIEFASFYRRFGVEVTVIEMQERILPAEDEEISALARKAFEKQGIVFHTGASVRSVVKADDRLTAVIEAPGNTLELTAERMISAVGIVGNVEDIGLESTRATVRNHHVVTDEWCRTGEPGIYAIGDVAGGPWLAHKASHEGALCVERIAGHAGAHPLEKHRIPGCTYSRPQIASIGLTEARALERGLDIRVGRFPFLANGKALALGEPDGLVKTIFDKRTGELIGAHLIGAEVTELIQGFAIGMALETTEEELMRTVFPHPTLSEAIHESVLAAFGRPLHI